METNNSKLDIECNERFNRAVHERISTLDNVVVLHPTMKEAIDGLLDAYSGQRDRSFWSNVTGAHEMVLRG